MLLNIAIVLMILGAFGALGATAFSRAAKLARLAQMYGCNFEKHKATVTTEISAGKLELFTQFFHQFTSVFTFTTNTAFIRMADDQIFTDEKAHTKPLAVTLFTVEMRRLQFPPLKIVPVDSPFSSCQYALIKTNIPQLDERYHIYAPSQASGVLLTQFITDLLKENPSIYLEVNDAALIYHEHALIEPEKMDDFRFRAMKIFNELETILVCLEEADNSLKDEAEVTFTHLQARADAMMKTFSASAPMVTEPNQNFRMFWFIVVVMLFLGITLFSWFALHNWVGK